MSIKSVLTVPHMLSKGPKTILGSYSQAAVPDKQSATIMKYVYNFDMQSAEGTYLLSANQNVQGGAAEVRLQISAR